MCYYHYGNYHEDTQTWDRFCVIQVSEKLKKSNLASKAVSWHEFCHAEPWILYGKDDDHRIPWIKRVLRKPILFMFGEIYSLIPYLLN